MKVNKMKQNSLELTQSQVKRVIEAEKGETIMLMFPIKLSDYQTNMGNILEDIENIYIRDGILHIYIKDDYRQLNKLPVQKGDKDIFVQEEFLLQTRNGSIGNHTDIKYRGDKNTDFHGVHKDDNSTYNTEWYSADIMTREQSRLTISECVDVSVVRIFDLKLKEIEQITSEPIYANLLHYELMFKDYYNNQLKEQNINRTYEDNDYVFLLEFKK